MALDEHYLDAIIGAESGGNPNARNPNSSAEGLGQFIDSTWLSVLRGARPDLAQGKSDAELLALKKDPELSREMTGVYAQQNQASLAKAGLPVTPGTTYLAHFAGIGDAAAVLNANPSAPAASVMQPASVRANPFLQNMTVGQLRAWADHKGSGQPGHAPMGRAGPLNAIPQPSAPIFGQPSQDGTPLPSPTQPSPTPPMYQPQSQASQGSEFLTPMAPLPPIFFPRPKQIDLAKLRAAFKQAQFNGIKAL